MGLSLVLLFKLYAGPEEAIPKQERLQSRSQVRRCRHRETLGAPSSHLQVGHKVTKTKVILPSQGRANLTTGDAF